MGAVAYMSWGRWVADCPNPGCTNAMGLDRGQTEFRCGTANSVGTCGTVAPIGWPTNADAVEQALAGRPPASQSWKPGDDL